MAKWEGQNRIPLGGRFHFLTTPSSVEKTIWHDPKAAKFIYNREWLQYLFWCENRSSHSYLGESGLEWLGLGRSALEWLGAAWSGVFELVFEFFIKAFFGKLGRCEVYWMKNLKVYLLIINSSKTAFGVGRSVFY